MAAELDRYLREYAPRFRAEFQAEFPQGVTVTRETWTQFLGYLLPCGAPCSLQHS